MWGFIQTVIAVCQIYFGIERDIHLGRRFDNYMSSKPGKVSQWVQAAIGILIWGAITSSPGAYQIVNVTDSQVITAQNRTTIEVLPSGNLTISETISNISMAQTTVMVNETDSKFKPEPIQKFNDDSTGEVGDNPTDLPGDFPISKYNIPNTANPNAIGSAKIILAYLWSLPARTNHKVLSGQSFSYSVSQNRFQYDEYITDIQNQTGHNIAVIGADLMFGPGERPTNWANGKITEHWNNGGIVTMSWHAMNPVNLTGTGDRNLNFSNMSLEGTIENIAWKKRLDLAANVLKELSDNGVVILWRPFHEMQGYWFWWGRRNPNDFKRAWRYMFDYFSYHHDLDNLLWVYSTAATNKAGDIEAQLNYYPGGNYIDIVGADYYPKSSSFKSSFAADYDKLRSTGKPFAITEIGLGTAGGGAVDYYNIIEGIRTYAPNTVFFFCWHDEWAMSKNSNIQKLLNDTWIADRDDIKIIINDKVVDHESKSINFF